MKNMMKTKFVASLAAVLMVFAGPAWADMSTLTLSDLSSDATPASVMDATLLFDVSGSTLTLTVTNDTSSPNFYDMNEVYFNASSNVTGLTLTPVFGWSFSTGAGADGFGTFDFALIDGTGGAASQIIPGESQPFVFAISGTGTYSALDFTTVFSSIPPGMTPALAAGKFVEGPGDDSAYGAVIPAPGAFLLGALGLSMVGWLKRKVA